MSTYTKALNFIRNATNAETIYEGVRNILRNDLRNYPEDWQIKNLQREADSKYEELTRHTYAEI
jgi:hypothetical protein